MSCTAKPKKKCDAAHDINVDDAGARVGSGIVTDCCGVGERRVSRVISTSEADGQGVQHGRDEDEDGVDRELTSTTLVPKAVMVSAMTAAAYSISA